MEILTTIETLILLAAQQLGERAYGIPIRERLEALMEKTLSVGAIYVPLDRLVKKGFLTAYTGEPTPSRGGRGKRFYEVTPTGLAALTATRRLHRAMWLDFSEAGTSAESP